MHKYRIRYTAPSLRARSIMAERGRCTSVRRGERERNHMRCSSLYVRPSIKAPLFVENEEAKKTSRQQRSGCTVARVAAEQSPAAEDKSLWRSAGRGPHTLICLRGPKTTSFFERGYPLPTSFWRGHRPPSDEN